MLMDWWGEVIALGYLDYRQKGITFRSLFQAFVSGTEILCGFIDFLAISTTYFIDCMQHLQDSKYKAVLIQLVSAAWSLGSQNLDSWHMNVVRLSALRMGTCSWY
jgi:hypothetical protein